MDTVSRTWLRVSKCPETLHRTHDRHFCTKFLKTPDSSSITIISWEMSQDKIFAVAFQFYLLKHEQVQHFNYGSRNPTQSQAEAYLP